MNLTTKLILAFVLAAIIPVIVFNSLNYRHTKQALEKEMLDNLIVTAEVQEGSIYNFLDAIKNRVIDFSSDGFLRKGVEEMRKLDTNDVRYTRLRKELIAHLRLNKKSLDKSIRSICIVDLNGRIIASTDRHNVNRGISTSAHFKQGLESACVSDVYPTYCCAATKHSYQISAVAPLVDKRTKTSYAVIVTCYSSKVLNKILSGQQQLNLGALSGLLGRRETLDTYLVNREKLLITPSKYSNEVMKRRVETLPVVEAAAGRETSGIYKNYLDVAVIGASMYFPSNGWTLCVEMSTKETFIPLVAMKNRIIILSIPTMLLAIFLAYVFSKRTHGALRESEERFKSFMDNNPAVAFMKDERGYFIYINATYMRIFKTTMENYIGKTDFDQWPVEVAKQLRENDKAVLSANKAIQTYEKVPTPDGILRDWLVLKFPVKDRSGSRYIGGVAIDVTERKQAERRLNAQHAVTQILTETVSLAGATPGIFKAICECLGWDVGGLWFVDTEYHVLRCADIWYLPLVKVPEFEAMSREITFSSGVGLPGCVWASGKPHWIIDVTKDSNFPRAMVAAKEGLHGAFCFPIMNGGEFLGVIEFFSHTVRQPDDDLLRMMAAIGRQIGLFVKRKQADEISKRFSRQNELILNSAGEGIYGIDQKGYATFINPTAAKMLGRGIDELIGKFMHAITHHSKPDGTPYPPEECPVFTVLQKGEIQRVDNEVFWRKDGTSFPVRYTSTPIVEQDKVVGAVVTFDDITERKKSEAQIRLQLQRLAVISNIDKVILSTLDLRVVLEAFLDKAFPQLYVDAADILLFNPYLQTLEYTVGRGFHTSAIQHTRVRLGEGCCGRAAVEHHPIFIHNLREESCVRSKQLSMEESFVSYYVVPIIAKGRVNGVLEVFHRAPLGPDQEWLGFLGMLAGQAAIAIDNVGLFEGLQHANTELVQAYDSTIEGWSHALDLRDKETEGHSRRVTDMTVQISLVMGINKEHLIHVRRGALLHDIGKMGVPDSILLKVESLTDGEWVIMRKHPVYAYELLARIAYLRPMLDIPYCHHEKWNGAGYPRGLKGEEIPLAARIFAVVDVWDAMRSDRPYRNGWAEEKVREHIKSLAGTHFDPQVAEVFLKTKW